MIPPEQWELARNSGRERLDDWSRKTHLLILFIERASAMAAECDDPIDFVNRFHEEILTPAPDYMKTQLNEIVTGFVFGATLEVK